jgi:hypothetical protein
LKRKKSNACVVALVDSGEEWKGGEKQVDEQSPSNNFSVLERFGAESPNIMFERSPGLVLVQPRSALLCGKGCRLNAIRDAQGVPTVSAPRVVAGATFN